MTTTDEEIREVGGEPPGDDERRAEIAARVKGPEQIEAVAALTGAEKAVLDAVETLRAEIAAKREQRAAIGEEIAELVEREKLWQPIERRLREGIKHRAEVAEIIEEAAG